MLSSIAQLLNEDWQISDKEILTLWTKIWPKMVALTWLNPGGNYRTKFTGSWQFRRAEAHRIAHIIGEHYDSNVPLNIDSPANLGMLIENFIGFALNDPFVKDPKNPKHDLYPYKRFFKGWSCPKTLYGETYFVVNQFGILMPLPNPPTRRSTFKGYFEGGGVLPRTNPVWSTIGAMAAQAGPPLPPDYYAGANIPPPAQRLALLNNRQRVLYDRIIDWADVGSNDSPNVNANGLTGVSLLTLFAKWPKIVAIAWDDIQMYIDNGTSGTPPRVTDIIGNAASYIMPEVWTDWPAYVLNNPAVLNNIENIIFRHASTPNAQRIDLDLPLPPPPAGNMANIYEELIVGYATNPMYSACY